MSKTNYEINYIKAEIRSIIYKNCFGNFSFLQNILNISSYDYHELSIKTVQNRFFVGIFIPGPCQSAGALASSVLLAEWCQYLQIVIGIRHENCLHMQIRSCSLDSKAWVQQNDRSLVRGSLNLGPTEVTYRYWQAELKSCAHCNGVLHYNPISSTQIQWATT